MSDTKHGKPARKISQVSSSLQTKHKLAISFSLLLLVVTSAFWLLFQNELNRFLSEHRDVLGESLAEQTASSVRELVLVNDPLGLNVALTQLVRDNTVIYAAVFDVDGRQLASAGQASINSISANSKSVLSMPDFYYADIAVQDAIAGSIQLELDASAINIFKMRMRNLFLLVLFISLVLVVTTAFVISGAINSPLKALANSIEKKIGADLPEDISSKNEIVILECSVENLLARFQEMEDQLLETETWQSERKGDENMPTRLATSILAINVVNINTAIELLPPPTLANLLGEYILYLNQAAALYGGKVYRHSGESVLLCFDSVNCNDRHSINALHCARLFQLLMKMINIQHGKNGEQNLEFQMAIHSGDIFQSPNIIDTEHQINSVLGKTADTALYLCKQSTPNELMISDSACSQARTFEQFETLGKNEVNMPADNVSFMAYILPNTFMDVVGLIQKQCKHILTSGNSTGQQSKMDS